LHPTLLMRYRQLSETVEAQRCGVVANTFVACLDAGAVRYVLASKLSDGPSKEGLAWQSLSVRGLDLVKVGSA
jgi:hypothetical protein